MGKHKHKDKSPDDVKSLKKSLRKILQLNEGFLVEKHRMRIFKTESKYRVENLHSTNGVKDKSDMEFEDVDKAVDCFLYYISVNNKLIASNARRIATALNATTPIRTIDFGVK